MNIYFVNRNSKLKGPFDIIDSNRQHIIKVGDICLRNTVDGVSFYVVYNSSNSWNSCKVVGFGDNDTLSDIGNTLLFSFDGLSRRKGDIALIKQLALCFREKVIDDFFRNAVDILEYRKDFWDGSLFPQFFASSQELINRDEQKMSDVRNDTNRYPSFFAKYLSEELQELLIYCLNDGNELKEAYQIIREKHPEMFRKAMLNFLKENPSGTIFDKPADAFVPTVIVKEVETPKESSRNFRRLVISKIIDYQPLETNERLERFLRILANQFLLTEEEEVELAERTRRGDIYARNKLVMANMRFVVSIAKQYFYKDLVFEDFLDEGFLGLIKATEHFDATRGIRFVSYAAWWIRRYITDAIIRDSFLIKFPLPMLILHKRIWEFKIRYERQNGFMPPITDIEIENEDNLERISFLDSLPNNLNNICIPCEDLDAFADNHHDIWDNEECEYNKQYVRSLLDRLSKKEREILIRAYGIGVREDTLEAIGESQGLTRERVRQIKEKAIRRLREMASVNSVDEKLSGNQSARKEESTGQAVTINKIIETRTLREVKRAFLQVRSDIVQFTEVKKRKPNDKVILRPEKLIKTSRKEIYLNTCNYTVVNNNGKCNIYDHNKSLVYSSTGNVKEINESFYRLSLTHNFFSIGVIKRNHKGELFNADIIMLANQQSKLHHKLKLKGFIELIEDIELDERRRVKVDGCWFDERGNEMTKETIEENHNRIPEIPNKIDEYGVEHVFVDSSDALPFRDVEVEIEQSDKEKIAERGETLPIWAFAENLQFTKRSKKFLKCECSVGLSKTGYYLIINDRFIKLGDYPIGYEFNVGNVWIKRPIDDKGYRMIHEKKKVEHLIGYAIEKGEKVVFTNPSNDVYSVTFDGKTTSGVKKKTNISLKDIDIDKLKHAFDKKVTSYKYFWFLAILKIYKEIRMDTIMYKDILIEMVSIAWRYVFVAESQFPSRDQLPVYLKAIQAKTYLAKSAKEKKVEETVQDTFYEWKWNALLIPLVNNVPYRFLSPWIPFTNNEEVIAKSQKRVSRCPYSITKDCITINPLWSNYLIENYDEISLFIEKELRSYLKCK